jgi:type I restriction enzyme M protein
MKFSEAKQLPQLFRDIFKQAFLPYRDPEVLGLFLKEISYFDYTHSEELGNAYEYLLSIMSSQGDAGQFRTPRHIIDFIVDVLAPTKDDTILDPACGTAGFLISAYNYIKRQNEGVDPETGKMRQLTADERRKLVNNFEGYDVDPTMVRMSQVNMYLHKFTTPKIYNYNALASEDRWNDKFDLILANPPFMSPKGGIKPHNKFSVQANRAEVLFVDYIMNHLKPKGRAGIIVPEGIIFQSGKAYKELRKNLVNDGLFAVVSLPAGVFNPYSGVKTSILFFDNEVAKKTKDLLFVKVTSDGYDLGAQRRKIEKDDLGDTGVILKGFREYVRTDQDKETIESFISGSGKGFIVSKEKISETGDYNLSADRYRIVNKYKDSKYDFVELGEVCDIFNGSTPKRTESDYWENGTIPWFTIDDIRKQGRTIKSTQQFITQKGFNESSVKLLPKNSTLICCTASVGEYAYTEIELTTNQQFNGLVIKDQYKQKLDSKFLFWCSTKFKDELVRMSGKSTFGFVSVGTLKKFKIPLPPIDVQKEIVKQIEVKQRAIDGAKQVIENLERERWYFGQSLRGSSSVEWAKLEDMSEIITKGTTPTTIGYDFIEQGVNFIKIESIAEYGKFTPSKFAHISDKCHAELKRSQLENGDILFSIAGALGRVAVVNKEILPANTNQALAIIRLKNKSLSKFISMFLTSEEVIEKIQNIKVGVAQYNISLKQIGEIEVPVISDDLSEKMIFEIEEQEKIVESNKKLIEMMEDKISGILNII